MKWLVARQDESSGERVELAVCDNLKIAQMLQREHGCRAVVEELPRNDPRQWVESNGETGWEVTYDFEHASNDPVRIYVDAVGTGLEIGQGVITWEEIDRARAEVGVQHG